MCAIAGAFNVPNASYLVSLMLKAMQHRGQEAAGIVACHNGEFAEVRGRGLVDEVFAGVVFATRLPGTSAIGHVRYTTTGDSKSLQSIQPLSARVRGTQTAIVHNGNLTDYAEQRTELERQGAIFASHSDTELFLHLLARADGDGFRTALAASLGEAHGAWSVLVMTPDVMHVAVDPFGFRPLVTATYGDGWLFASETCAFDLFGITKPHHVSRGTMMCYYGDGTHNLVRLPNLPDVARQCSFEHVYFTRPDSDAFDVSSNDVRERLGALLAKSAPADVDLVIPVPDSSNAIAITYAEGIGVPFRHALIRNHYTGRTFITPTQPARELGVRMKLNVVRHLVAGKRVAVVDDSLVRGTTARKVTELLRAAGAKEVHLRIGSPPVVHPCFWGIDTPSRKELVAAEQGAESLLKKIGADSLAYLSIDDLRIALRDEDQRRYCLTCFSGILPDNGLIMPESLVRKPTI
jgi:amidophosphoribosyltransferase